jgi:hypothetical protein
MLTKHFKMSQTVVRELEGQ